MTTKDCCQGFLGYCPPCSIKRLPDAEELFNPMDTIDLMDHQ